MTLYIKLVCTNQKDMVNNSVIKDVLFWIQNLKLLWTIAGLEIRMSN